MFERFTEPARHAVVYAQEAATDEIGIDQLVYGLLREREGIAARVPCAAGYAQPSLPPPRRTGPGQIPFTREAHGALKRASEEADALGHRVVGTEHILLAAKPELRDAVLRALSGDEP